MSDEDFTFFTADHGADVVRCQWCDHVIEVLHPYYRCECRAIVCSPECMEAHHQFHHAGPVKVDADS